MCGHLYLVRTLNNSKFWYASMCIYLDFNGMWITKSFTSCASTQLAFYINLQWADNGPLQIYVECLLGRDSPQTMKHCYEIVFSDHMQARKFHLNLRVFLSLIYKPLHDRTNKMAGAPSEDRSASAHVQSNQSLRSHHE